MTASDADDTSKAVKNPGRRPREGRLPAPARRHPAAEIWEDTSRFPTIRAALGMSVAAAVC